MHEAINRAQEWLRQHESDLLQDTQKMLRIPSVQSDPLPNAPFGTENRRALDLALSLASEWGWKTADVEGYCGWAEVGDGPAMVLVMGHLDVVPVGPGWKHEPFGAEVDGEYLYSRGATDDKGPSMAAFYAIRALTESGVSFPGRLRMFFGCNEESGFECIHRYTKTEELPTLGVAPDSGWPLYFAEKGIVNFVISYPIPDSSFRLLSAEGGTRPNIVVERATASVRVSAEAKAHVESKLADAWDKNLDWKWEGDDLQVVSHGKAAHGATPFMGDSAGTRLFRFLHFIAPGDAQPWLEEILWTTHSSGVGLGIHGRDDVSDDLTANLGTIHVTEGKLELLYNIRRPVTWAMDEVRNRLDKFCAKSKFGPGIVSFTPSEPLYFPLDHVLTKTIVEVYRAETGDMKEPGAMGGGTYARAVPECVSIGTGWEGDGPAHENDERLKVEHLYKMSRIYAHLFWRLMEEAAKLKS